MSNVNITPFFKKEFGEIRVINIDEKPHFIGNDIAKALGYVKPNNAVNSHCKHATLKQGIIIDSLGRFQDALVIPEGDVYRLISKSKLPSAEKFESWVFDEVLPQIRKTGGYIPINEEMSEAEIMAKALLISQKTIEKKDELLKSKTRELEDKNKFINQIASSQNTLLVREVAKVISSNSGIVIGEKKLYQKLRDWGLIFKNKNEPQQKYIKQGLLELTEGVRNTSTGTFTYQTMRVTGKGQEYILKRLLREQQVYSQWA